MVLWGVGMGAHGSVMRAAIAPFAPRFQTRYRLWHFQRGLWPSLVRRQQFAWRALRLVRGGRRRSFRLSANCCSHNSLADLAAASYLMEATRKWNSQIVVENEPFRLPEPSIDKETWCVLPRAKRTCLSALEPAGARSLGLPQRTLRQPPSRMDR
jgi:hypothetical protein